MSGLKSTVQRFVNASVGKGFKSNKERRMEREAKHQSALDRLYSAAHMPDEQELRREEGRKAARRRGSRASTILTDRETLG
jgi:hypothetical protein